MRTLVVVLSTLGLALTGGCKTDKKPPAQTGSAGSAVAGAGSAAVKPDPVPVPSTGSAGDQVKPVDITLPKGPGTPPTKTTQPLRKAAFEKLAELEFPGFKKEVREKEKAFDVRHTTPRPMISTTVTIVPCFDCTPMELARWKAKEEALKVLLPAELRSRPDTVFEIGQTEINGAPMIFTYQLAHHYGVDEQNNPMGGFSNAYALYFNDGTNQIRVVAQYKDDPASREDILKMAPREDLEKFAKAFMDAYTHAW